MNFMRTPGFAVLAASMAGITIQAQTEKPASGLALFSPEGAPERPLLEIATGRRFQAGARAWMRPPPCHYAGYGIPFTLRWVPQGQGQLLSYREGGEVIRREVAGQSSQVITPKGRLESCTVEALEEAPGPGAWRRHSQAIPVHVRGMYPYAGNPLLAGGDEDGPALSARFRAPFGLAWVNEGAGDDGGRTGCLVSDCQSDVVRLVSEDGQVSTPWGAPWCGSLFKGPTFLCVSDAWFQGARLRWQCRVSDSGNHCLRVIRPDGSVATFAGSPGQAGHLDSALGLQARFNNPQGLAEDAEGNLYVADQGNHVIRRVSPEGEVRTLAGSPGEPGQCDGRGAQARFRELRGLAICPSGSATEPLYAADGHGIRRISLPEGEVTTPLGVVDTPGFREVQGGSSEARRQALRQPCLNRPCGLLARPQSLEIADQGNNSVRTWSFPRATLTTLVGDPSLGETRWGLLREGLEAPLDERFAALEAPRTLVAHPRFGTALLVSAGSCLGEINPASGLRDRLAPLSLECPQAPLALAEVCAVRFSAGTTTAQGSPSTRPIHYSVDFREPDGSLSERVEGVGVSSEPLTVQGCFRQRGRGTVVIRCVTDQGVSAGAQGRVEVR